MFALDTLVHGRYRVVQHVGRGGMGAVYEALDARLRCRVALKELCISGDRAGAAFEHEAQLLASLRHPVLPGVIDHFVDDAGQFLVMQFIPGEDMATGLSKRGTGFSLADILPWIEALFRVLDYLHSRQPPVVHRDIKPANLKLTPDGEIVLLDFGLAKGTVGGAGEPTTPSVAGYTPRYSPLEQIDGTGTDPRSDIYALGATIYHLLTGIAPPNALERATALVNGEADPLRDAHLICPGVALAVSTVLTRSLAIGRSRRYPSVAAMRADWRAAVSPGDADPTLARPETRPRRVDAAVPSRAQVGTRVDLIVQVRFPDSPRLGLEDWPSRRLPASVEQTSEVVRLAFPVDVVTGRAGPARLQVRVVAPDFLIESQTQQAVEVPPDAYSQRLSFLLTALRPGVCRINVEVYAADSVFLGAVPVETDVGGAPIDVGQLCVSNLVLSVIARQVADLMAKAAAVPPTDVTPVPRATEIIAVPPAPYALSSLALDEQELGLTQSSASDDCESTQRGFPSEGSTIQVHEPVIRAEAGADARPPTRAARPPRAERRAGDVSDCAGPPARPSADVAATLRVRGPMARLTRALAPVAAVVLIATAGLVYYTAQVQAPAGKAASPVVDRPSADPAPSPLPPPATPQTVARPIAEPSAPEDGASFGRSPTHPFVSVRISTQQSGAGVQLQLVFENDRSPDVPVTVDAKACVIRDGSGGRYVIVKDLSEASSPAADPVLRASRVQRQSFLLQPSPVSGAVLRVTIFATHPSDQPLRFGPLVVSVR